MDRNEKQNDGDAADENVAVNVEETRKKRRKKSKEENSYSTTTISHPCKSSAVASFIGISEDKAIKEVSFMLFRGSYVRYTNEWSLLILPGHSLGIRFNPYFVL